MRTTCVKPLWDFLLPFASSDKAPPEAPRDLAKAHRLKTSIVALPSGSVTSQRRALNVFAFILSEVLFLSLSSHLDFCAMDILDLTSSGCLRPKLWCAGPLRPCSCGNLITPFLACRLARCFADDFRPAHPSPPSVILISGPFPISFRPMAAMQRISVANASSSLDTFHWMMIVARSCPASAMCFTLALNQRLRWFRSMCLERLPLPTKKGSNRKDIGTPS